MTDLEQMLAELERLWSGHRYDEAGDVDVFRLIKAVRVLSEGLAFYANPETYRKYTLITDPRLPRTTDVDQDKGREADRSLTEAAKALRGDG